MLWGYEIKDERGFVLGDEGEYVFRSKQDAFLDALDYAADIVKDTDVEKSIIVEVQPVDENYVNPDYVK
jgi:hypothetical protein